MKPVPEKRQVEPEILDSLPQDHPDALRNRRDLRLINLFTGNFRWFERVLRTTLLPDDNGVEMGAGDGWLGRRLEKRGRLPAGFRIDGLDLWRRPGMWPESWGWLSEDLMTFSAFDRYDFVLANLILHQFDDDQLRDLGQRLRGGPRLIVACEPCRRSVHLRQFRLLKPFGLNHVSWHDGQVSIRGGFIGDELPELLGLTGDSWNVRCDHTALGMYRMVALKP